MEAEKFTQAKEINGLIENLKSRINKAEKLLTTENISCKVSGKHGEFKYPIDHYINNQAFIHTSLLLDIEKMKSELLILETKFSEI